MLDEATIDQLRSVFASLQHEYQLVLSPSNHPKQADLRELAEALAGTSPKLHVVEAGAPVAGVRLELQRDAQPLGLVFRGVPGGHEFTSLVLAILNSDGKGKLPDEGLRQRARALKGPATLTTYISLSCTNCPDVVQALNLIAMEHADIVHEMVDGELAPEEIAARGIQAVPSVFLGDKLLSVGKSDYGTLLDLLARELGTNTPEVATAPQTFEAVVVGGGPAGVASAIYLARKGLKTALVAERLGGQVLDTLGIENLIGTTYTEGPKLAAELEAHARSYPLTILPHRRATALTVGDAPTQASLKQLSLASGETLQAPTVIIAAGAKWRELGVPGEKTYLGRGVAFCPHCDGPFYKGKRVAVIGGGNSGVEAAIDLAGITHHVTLVEFASELRADAVLVANLRARTNVTIITNARTTEVLGDGSKVTGLAYVDRTTEAAGQAALDGVFVQIGLVPNSAGLGEALKRNRSGEIEIDGHGRTSVPGVYAAGDVTTVPYKQIVVAMGAGATAALAAFEDRMRQTADAG